MVIESVEERCAEGLDALRQKEKSQEKRRKVNWEE